MEGNFNDFPDIPDVDVESTDKSKDIPEDSKRFFECFNRVIKEMRKQNKLFRQLCRRIVVKEPAVEEVSTAPKGNNSTNTTAKKSEISFFEKLGDAFLKAFPSILRTIATVAVPLLFGHISRRMGNFREAVT